MESELNKKIFDAIGFLPAGTHGLGQSKKQFKTILTSHDVRGRFNGVYNWRLTISMTQKQWGGFDLALFEWKLRDQGLGVEFVGEEDELKDIKEIVFNVKEFYIKPCNRR